MTKTVTVEQALKKGRWQLKNLPMIVTFVIIGGGVYLSYAKIFGGWIIPLGFLTGFVSGWLVWSYYVNHWKIWAYENVRNIHELQRKAVEEKLIWRNGSWFEKTEFKNYEQKQKLKQLEKKFLEKDVYKDDISVPKETRIFYSKSILIFILSINMVITFVGCYMISKKEYLGLLFLGFGIGYSFDQIKKLRDNKPQLIINDKGIELNSEKIISWNNIHNERVFSTGRRPKTYLAFNDKMIDIDELTIKFNDLENLLNVYRTRFENNNNL